MNDIQTGELPATVPPIGGLSIAHLARLHGVSLRSVERALRILHRGVPELVALVEKGELKLSPAEFIAHLPLDRQREIVAQGAEACRQLAGAKRPRKQCPHCGGAL